MTLSDRLKSIREDLGKREQRSDGYSQFDMSRRFDLGEKTWAQYERDGRMPRGSTLLELAGLGYSLDWLATARGTMKVSESPVPGAVDWDPELMRDVLREVEEVLIEEGPQMPVIKVLNPERDPSGILGLYAQRMLEKSGKRPRVGSAEVLRLVRPRDV